MPLLFKNSINSFSLTVGKAREFGCELGLAKKLAFLVAILFSTTSRLLNAEVVLSLFAIFLISSLFSLFLPCLTCKPFNAKL
jgi:hypothetical protein